MESEADMGAGMLSTEISTRRRSHSVSDDYSVQKTNGIIFNHLKNSRNIFFIVQKDDATECKYVAVQVIYLHMAFYIILENWIPHFGEEIKIFTAKILCGQFYWSIHSRLLR